ncbi:MAG: hypothetical protein AB8C84_11095, partial [Oligoflexales bacterium]
MIFLRFLLLIVIALGACEDSKVTNSRSLSGIDTGVKSASTSKIIAHTEDTSIQTLNGTVNVKRNTFDSPVKIDIQDTGERAFIISAMNNQSSTPNIQKDIEVCMNLPAGALGGAKVKISDLEGGDGTEVEGVQSSEALCIQTRSIPGIFSLVLSEKNQLGETLTYTKDFSYGTIQMAYDSTSLNKDQIYFIENADKPGVMEGGILGDFGQEISEWLSKGIEICWSLDSKNITTMTFIGWDKNKTVYKGTFKGDLICFVPENFIGSFILGAQEIETISTEKTASLNSTPILSLDPVSKGDTVSVYT